MEIYVILHKNVNFQKQFYALIIQRRSFIQEALFHILETEARQKLMIKINFRRDILIHINALLSRALPLKQVKDIVLEY